MRPRCLLFAIASLIAFASGASAQGGGEFVRDAKTGCKLWSGPAYDRAISGVATRPPAQLDPALSVQWSGGCAKGMADGQGVATWLYAGRQAATSEGQFRDGKLNGVAKSGGYDGEWRDGRRNGRGVQHFAAPSASDLTGRRDSSPPPGEPGAYDGEWADGLPNGMGTYRRPNSKETLTGRWQNGCFDDGSHKAAVMTTRRACGFD